MKKLWVILAALVAVYASFSIVPHSLIGETPWRTGRPLVIAHAGGKGIAPDNTLKAFRYAHSVGAVLEMDVPITADEVLITRHGENVTGNLRQLTQCDVVSWDVTYEFIYTSCNGAYKYNVDDCKSIGPSIAWIVADSL